MIHIAEELQVRELVKRLDGGTERYVKKKFKYSLLSNYLQFLKSLFMGAHKVWGQNIHPCEHLVKYCMDNN